MSELRTQARLVSSRQIEGYVFDPANPELSFVVELILDGAPADIARAALPGGGTDVGGADEGRHRYAFLLEEEVARTVRTAEIRVANTGERVGEALRLDVAPTTEVDARRGCARWIGGLRFTGWISMESDGVPPRVRAFVDGVEATEARADRWAHIDGMQAPVCEFDLNLPRRLADGRARLARILDESGRELTGSPCAFLAFDGGLERFLEGRAELESERARARLFDRLTPQSLPFSQFEAWSREFASPVASARERPRVAVAVIGDEGIAATIESLEAQIDCSWVVGMIGRNGGQTGFLGGDLRQYLEAGALDCEIVVFALAGTVFAPQALAAFADALESFANSNVAYCDLAVASAQEKLWPVLFPAFDYERMLEQGYPALVFAARAAYAREAAARDVGDLFRLFNMSLDRDERANARGASAPPVHVPQPLAQLPALDLRDATTRLIAATHAHLETRGAAFSLRGAVGSLLPAVRLQRAPPSGKTSIVIATRNRVDWLRPCLESLAQTLDEADVEIIVVDNESADPEAARFLDEIASERVRVVRVSGPFNRAGLLAKGASIASGKYLLLLGDDVEPVRAGWLEEMLGRLAGPEVGVVGGLLLWRDGLVQNGGIALGPGFEAAPAFAERRDDDSGYADMLAVARETSAVSSSCLLMRRRVFFEFGGVDGAGFRGQLGDVDFCLRLRAAGFRIVFTPHARFWRRAGDDRGDFGPGGEIRRQKELADLRRAWGDALANDPAYNPQLALDGAPFSALAWPPRSLAPRLPFVAPANTAPPGI